jgi:hypothetical protein
MYSSDIILSMLLVIDDDFTESLMSVVSVSQRKMCAYFFSACPFFGSLTITSMRRSSSSRVK